MSRSENTPHKPDNKWGEHDVPGQWSGIKPLRKLYNRKTRHSFKNTVRSVKDWEELDDLPEYEDFRKRSQAKWDF